MLGRASGKIGIQKNQPSLPVNRAFAVQIHADAQVQKGQLKGRVEHVPSGEATHFESLAELQAFIIRVVTKLPRKTGENDE